MKEMYLIRSATAPETMVAAVPQNTSWKKNLPQKGTVEAAVAGDGECDSAGDGVCAHDAEDR